MIGKLLNTILAPLNFHLTKRSSMEQILGELQTIQQQYQEMQRRDQDREETLLRLQQQEKEHYLRMLEYSMFSAGKPWIVWKAWPRTPDEKRVLSVGPLFLRNC